jgi:hypothetical protein
MHQGSPFARQSARGRRLAALAALYAIVAAAPLQAQSADVTGLSGLVVDETDLPADALSKPQLEDLPGVRMPPPLPLDLQQRLEELSAQRAAIGAVSPSGAAPALLAPLPGESNAPARRDAGDRDPDRLRTAPALPRNR